MIKLKNLLEESFKFNTLNLNEQDTTDSKKFYLLYNLSSDRSNVSDTIKSSKEDVINTLNILYHTYTNTKTNRYNISDMANQDLQGNYIIDDFAIVTDSESYFEKFKSVAKEYGPAELLKIYNVKVSNVNKDTDINNNGYPDNSETGNTFRRIYGQDMDADDEDASWEILDWCNNPFETMLSRWEPKGWPKLPNGKSYYTAADAGDKHYNFHFDANPQVVLYNNQLYAGVNVSEAYAHEFQGRGLIAKWLENAIPDIVKHYQACSYVKKNYPGMIIKPCLQVDGDESGGVWEKLCRKNGWTLFDY